MDDFQHLDDYALLGVAPHATPDELKQAYRREIAKYHPDRFRHADPQAQTYAQQRAQRITEVYAALTRNPRTRVRSRPASPPLATSTDQLSATYERALALMAAGDTVEAARLLRQIQKVDPLYRDVDEQLARAEAGVVVEQRRRTPLLWAGAGALGVLALLGGGYGVGFWSPRPATQAASGSAPAVALVQPSRAASDVALASASAAASSSVLAASNVATASADVVASAPNNLPVASQAPTDQPTATPPPPTVPPTPTTAAPTAQPSTLR